MKAEFIGKHLEVVTARNPANVGIKGKIIDETKETLLVRTPEGKRRLIKRTITFKMQQHIIHGEEVRYAPEERIKTKRTNGRSHL